LSWRVRERKVNIVTAAEVRNPFIFVSVEREGVCGKSKAKAWDSVYECTK